MTIAAEQTGNLDGSRLLTIGDERVAGDDGTYPVVNPARPAEVVFDAPSASIGQVDRAVAAARGAAPGWAGLPLEERQRWVTEATAFVGEAANANPALAALLTRENGKVLIESIFELATVGSVAGMFCDMATVALAPRTVEGGGMVSFEPFGVVALLLPFNWPVAVLVSKLAPALVAGNVVVLKPPPSCPGAVLQIAGEIASRLPPGVVNTINGPGIEVGEALVGHPGVDMVSLTGGDRTGRAVMGTAAKRLSPVLLELGGNDAAIIAPDVVPDEALADQLLQASFVTSGQVCMALKRLYVPESQVGPMVEALVAKASSTVVGDGLAPETTLGPVHTARGAQFAQELVAEAESSGAPVHRAGRLRDEDAGSEGYFVVPTIVEGPAAGERVVTEEQFAPILPVIGYRELDEAVAAANDTRYGLGASIWSGDAELAASVARRLEAGTVFQNAHGPMGLDPRLPFGGWKQSGIGREYGNEGITAYTQQRAILPIRPLPA